MCDYDLIKKICNLTCSYEDIHTNKANIKCDYIDPFKKYYNIETIIKAINKYLNNEWNERFLANWAKLYNFILAGGFSEKVHKSKRVFIEEYIEYEIEWTLDALSNFEEEYYLNDEKCPYDLNEKIKEFKLYDLILKSAKNWKVFYYNDKKIDKNGQLLLVDDINKKSVILKGIYYLDVKEENFYKTDEKEQKQKIDFIKENGYTTINF